MTDVASMIPLAPSPGFVEQSDDNPKGGYEEVVTEAKDRFQHAAKWEHSARNYFLDDIKFANADAYNGYQWPNDIRRNRDVDERPCLTINKVRQHNLQIINDCKKNKPEIKIRPTGNGATAESAEAIQALMRHIEYRSNASTAYDLANTFQVQGGIGYIRVTTAYVDPESFDQEILIKRVTDPMCIYMDPEAKEADKSDSRFCFIFDDVLRDEFDKMFPEYKQEVSEQNVVDDEEGWVRTDYVRVCEYFRKVEEDDVIYAYRDEESGNTMTVRESVLRAAPDLLAQIKANPRTKSRWTKISKIEWYFIIGTKVVQKGIWPGKYIPIVPVIGEESVIEGIMDRKGHTRAMIDPQRMYNYWAPLDLNTPIPTPEGWTTMGDVQKGDWLLDEQGKPCKVLGTSPVHTDRKCYKIQFDDDSCIIADGEHRWTVEERGKRRAATYDWKKRVITTAELEPKKHFIYVTKPLELPKASLPIDPYVLGVWLGDGTSAGNTITSGNVDVEDMRRALEESGHVIGLPIQQNASSWSIPIYGLTSKLKNLSLFDNKHIPNCYLRSSVEQRWALLQGLMDTDGSFGTHNNQCSFTTASNRLATDFSDLLRSLGIKAVKCERPAKSKMFPNGEIYTSAPFIQFSFTADPTIQIFRLKRKLELQQKVRPVHERRTKRHGIASITEVSSVPVKCVAVDNESHLFLAGEGMIPTHNSAAVEYGALQGKTPWIAPAEAIEGYESYWNTANKVNHSVLPYNGLNDAGEPIPPPQRVEPPVAAPVAMTGMQVSAAEFMMVSGQYQNQMGEQGNERSAKAINERVRQGETSTYHFIDNQAVALRQVGRICLDLFPHIYDTPRLMQIQANDGIDFNLEIDPRAQQIFAKRLDHEGKVTSRILNPIVGQYEVQADVGPSWGTKREEAFNALALILTQAPQLTSIIGDLLLMSSDFDKANEAAARLRRMVPPQALGEGPSVQEQQLQMQVQQLTGILQKTMEEMAQDKLRLRGHAEKRDVDVYNAFTGQLKVLLDYKAKVGEKVDPKEIDDLMKSTVTQSLDTDLGQLVKLNAGEAAGDAGAPGGVASTYQPPEPPPVPGAKKGSDGHWYMRDLARSGSWSRVM